VYVCVCAADRLCLDHTHFAIAVFDELLNIPIDTVFEHYFTDSALFRDFVAFLKMSGKPNKQHWWLFLRFVLRGQFPVFLADKISCSRCEIEVNSYLLLFIIMQTF